MKILIVTGSISQQSNNKRIARWFDKNYGDTVEITHFPLETIPMYNMDIELDPPAEIVEMRRHFQEADGIVMITPEYNHSVPGVLKNLIDWASRSRQAIKGKLIFMLGGSTGRFGTIRAQMHLTQILAAPGVEAILFTRQLQIGRVHEKFSPEGDCLDPTTEKYLKRGMDEFIAALA
ncbi:MAG TPA: NADPH-dependent FMN reductase [Bacillota bacterium]|jgi:chromate reductase|nr:NAD(P)H-dependent oxidoreductase [Fastidiosipila sp.]HPX93665.1 NADPH-dependent FMN reductase [Bacillota bacterium]HQB81431.1 NADPH-dependent FMN reductase [Bacillota bacterium]